MALSGFVLRKMALSSCSPDEIFRNPQKALVEWKEWLEELRLRRGDGGTGTESAERMESITRLDASKELMFQKVQEMIGDLFDSLSRMVLDAVAAYWSFKDSPQQASGKSFSKAIMLAVLSAVTDYDDIWQAFKPSLKVAKVMLDIQSLQIRRGELLLPFLQEVSSWDRPRVEVELRKRKRDFDNLPTELSPHPSMTRDGVVAVDPAVFAPLFITERKFAQDLIFELEGILAGVSYALPPPVESPPDPVDAKLKRLEQKGKLMEQWREARERAALDDRPLLDREYRELLDELNEGE